MGWKILKARLCIRSILSDKWTVNDECNIGQQLSSTDLMSVKCSRSKSGDRVPPRLRTSKTCNLLDALVTISVTCKSHLKLFWIAAASHFWDLVFLSLLVPTVILGRGYSLLRWTEAGNSLHFLGFNIMLLLLFQVQIASNWPWSIDNPCAGVISEIFISSKYILPVTGAFGC